MNMTVTRFVQWLLTRTGAGGTRDALVGDLMEELAHGRSSWWVCQELVGFYGLAFVAQARESVRITPLLVALVLGLVLVGSASIASFERVIETWTSAYYLAGTVSLFAHVMSRSTASHRLLITGGVGLEARDAGQA
jgi:hypothetical protein